MEEPQVDALRQGGRTAERAGGEEKSRPPGTPRGGEQKQPRAGPDETRAGLGKPVPARRRGGEHVRCRHVLGVDVPVQAAGDLLGLLVRAHCLLGEALGLRHRLVRLQQVRLRLLLRF